MDIEALSRLCHLALVTVLLAIAPIVIISMLVGFVVAFLEAVTSIQDQAVVTAVRLLSVVVLLLVSGGDVAQLVLNFAQEQFQALANVGVLHP